MRTKLFLIVGLTLLSFACNKKPTEPIPEPSPIIDGTWNGMGVKSGFNYIITADLFQTDTTVIGTGNISVFPIVINFTVSGSNVYPSVKLNMANQDSSFTGTFVGKFDSTDANKIVGLASVPAFQISNEPLTIKRISN